VSKCTHCLSGVAVLKVPNNELLLEHTHHVLYVHFLLLFIVRSSSSLYFSRRIILLKYSYDKKACDFCVSSFIFGGWRKGGVCLFGLISNSFTEIAYCPIKAIICVIPKNKTLAIIKYCMALVPFFY